jgi:hypothetical protein
MRKIARRPTIYRHSVHAEWGHGIVVEETPAKLYLYFDEGGLRPFMNDPKYRDQLVAVTLPLAEVQALVALAEKKVGTKAKPAARKKKVPPKASTSDT